MVTMKTLTTVLFHSRTGGTGNLRNLNCPGSNHTVLFRARLLQIWLIRMLRKIPEISDNCW